MQHKGYSTLLLTGILALLCSCKNIQPAPDLLTALPSEDSRYQVGDSIHVQSMFDQGVLIQQYKLQLVLTPPHEYVDTTSDLIAFSSDSYLYISGQGYNQNLINDRVPIAVDLMPGNYHLVISALNDNLSESKDTVNVIVYNPLDTVVPFMSITSPTEGFVLNVQDTLSIFTIVNEYRSNLVRVRAQRQMVTLINSATGEVAGTLVNTGDPLTDTVQRQYIIPSTLSAGGYALQFYTLDEFNNDSLQVVNIQVQ